MSHEVSGGPYKEFEKLVGVLDEGVE